MRDLSIQFLDDIFAESTGSTPVILMRVELVSNTGVLTTLRFCQNSTPITSNGQLYQPAVFNVALGKDISTEVPTINLTFDIGDRSLVTQLREFNKAPKFYMSVAVAERPNVIEFAEVEYQLTNFTINETNITMTLQVEPILNEPIPLDRVTPLTAPALWENITVDNTGVERPIPTNTNYSGGGGGGGTPPSNTTYPEIER